MFLPTHYLDFIIENNVYSYLKGNKYHYGTRITSITNSHKDDIHSHITY